jgi:hypothetical protein
MTYKHDIVNSKHDIVNVSMSSAVSCLDGGRDEAEAPADLPGEALAHVHLLIEILAGE